MTRQYYMGYKKVRGSNTLSTSARLFAPETIERVVFTSPTVPTEVSHGREYICCVGPFKTKQGAEFMRDYGTGNPHCQTVDDAERLAKLNKS